MTTFNIRLSEEQMMILVQALADYTDAMTDIAEEGNADEDRLYVTLQAAKMHDLAREQFENEDQGLEWNWDRLAKLMDEDDTY